MCFIVSKLYNTLYGLLLLLRFLNKNYQFYVSFSTGNIKKRPDAMVFANCKRYGNYKGHLKDVSKFL